MNQYLRRRYQERKEHAFDVLGGECWSCGTKEGLCIFHADSPAKKVRLSTLSRMSEKRFVQALRDCKLYCRKCGREAARENTGQCATEENHGTVSCYRYCRCDLCRAAHNERNRHYRRRKDSNVEKQP